MEYKVDRPYLLYIPHIKTVGKQYLYSADIDKNQYFLHTNISGSHIVFLLAYLAEQIADVPKS